MKLLGGALNALEILAKRARDGLVDSAGRVGVVWHACSHGFSRAKSPDLSFWKLGAWESTASRYRCAQKYPFCGLQPSVVCNRRG